jgi:hypothetical protein
MTSRANAEPPGPDIEAVINDATLAETSVPLCLAGHLQGRYEDLQRQLSEAAATVGQSLAGTSTAAIAGEIEAVRAEMAQHLVKFHFRALDPKAWSDLIAAHPARNDQELFNPETAAPAAVAACAVSPAMTVEQYERLAKKLTHGQQEALLSAVWKLNVQVVQAVPFSLLASATAGSLTGGK